MFWCGDFNFRLLDNTAGGGAPARAGGGPEIGRNISQSAMSEESSLSTGEESALDGSNLAKLNKNNSG